MKKRIVRIAALAMCLMTLCTSCTFINRGISDFYRENFGDEYADAYDRAMRETEEELDILMQQAKKEAGGEWEKLKDNIGEDVKEEAGELLDEAEDAAREGLNETGLMLAALRLKFPDGKYWNSVGVEGNNQDHWTDQPCPSFTATNSKGQPYQKHTKGETANCNWFNVNGSNLSQQCMGFAEKLGYDVTGFNPRDDENGWSTLTGSGAVSAVDNIKAGDIVHFSGHSVYIIGVSDSKVTVAECNWNGPCLIEWGRQIDKSKLKSGMNYIRIAPFEAK